MHEFEDLLYRGTLFSLNALEEFSRAVHAEGYVVTTTNAVKSLQMIQLQKAIIAIGQFSLFESILQDKLACKNGFSKTKEILREYAEESLLERFEDFYLAINVLKHGRGRSYDILLLRAQSLPFQVKLPDQSFFNEGDISEIAVLVEVDDEFLLSCVDLIKQVSRVIDKNFTFSTNSL